MLSTRRQRRHVPMAVVTFFLPLPLFLPTIDPKKEALCTLGSTRPV